MSKGLDFLYAQLRRAINDCDGYRVLDDNDVIEKSDETVRGSGLLGEFGEKWTKIGRDKSLKVFVGCTVKDMNDSRFNDEMDVSERMFRRKVSQKIPKSVKCDVCGETPCKYGDCDR